MAEGARSTGRPLGLAHFTVLEVPPLDLVSLAASIGYASVGLRLHPAFPGAPCYEAPAGSAASRELRRRLFDEGMRVHDIEFVTMAPDFRPESLLPVLEAAGELDARRLSVCGDDPDRSRLAGNFAALCALARPFGLGVDMEWMAWRTPSTLAETVAIVEAAGAENGAVLIDALHLARTGGTPAQVGEIPRALIRSGQLCDGPAKRPPTDEAILSEARTGRLAPGDGDLPLLDLLSALPRDAVLSVEVPMASDVPPRTRATQIFTASQRLLRTWNNGPTDAPV